MKLVDALEILRRSVPEDADPLSVALICGFTPLHLETLLNAELRQASPGVRTQISTGLFDDLAGSLERLGAERHDAVAIVVEWADIDPRLGLRRLGGWRLDDLDDVSRSAVERLDFIGRLLIEVASTTPVACCLPTLPLPPMFLHASTESGAQELELRGAVASFASELARKGGVRIVSTQTLDELSPVPARRDVRSELGAGFPYSLAHAAAVASLLATLIKGPAPKKGLITDLDDTLWAGTVGEVGAANVTWNLEGHSQAHGLYQQLLASFAAAGVLIGVASKNEPAIVAEAFEREDLVLPKDDIFPIEAHWEPKSTSVQVILDAWNVAADDVVFVDDSPMELAEVADAFPTIQPVLFPDEESGIWELLRRLRDLFGKPDLKAEDSLRMSSLRSAAELRTAAQGSRRSLDDFLGRAGGTVTFSFADQRDDRALELINKTNQFNLNGERLTEAALDRLLGADSAFLLTVAYQDKYGPLGRIGALVGQVDGSALSVGTWVMSCRAFSRRIEHHTIAYVFERLDVNEISLSYAATERNMPMGEFLASVTGAPPAAPTVLLTRAEFFGHEPLLVHGVAEAAR